MGMTFSILQSVYYRDNPEYLYQSLQSIYENTLKPTEIILVKDGVLTAELDNVINEWQKLLPLKIVGYNDNKGLAYALNFGLQFVETDLVARMDSDDICYSNRFEKQVLEFEIDDKLSILGTGIEEFYNNELVNFKQIRLYPKYSTKKSLSLYKGTPLAHPTVMMRTNVLKQFGYSEKTKCNEDIELWFRLLGEGYEIRTLQEPLLHFRITDGTFSRRSLKKAINEYNIYSRALKYINGITKNNIYLLLRLFSRLIPKSINKKLYLSSARNKMFKENLMEVKALNGQVFMKNGHLFEALLELNNEKGHIIKAVQLDTESNSNNVVEILADDIKLYKLHDSANLLINV